MNSLNVGSVTGTLRLRDEMTAALNRAASRVSPFVVKADLLRTSLSSLQKQMSLIAKTPAMRVNAVGFAQNAAIIRQQNEALAENLAAIRQGPQAFAALNKEKEIYLRLSEMGIAIDSKAGRAMVGLIEKQQLMRAEIARLSYSSKTNIETLAMQGRTMAEVGRRISFSLGLPLAIVSGAVIKTAKDFESSFAGIRKTIIASDAEYAELALKMRGLAKQIPVNVNDLNQIGQVAGQLNIAKENIVDFTRVMAGLGFATNLTATEAAEALARFTNITQTPQTQVENLASTIVALGNGFQGAARNADGLSGKLATTEAEIVEMATRFAAAGHTSRLSAAQILGIAAAVTSVGVEAELGGTAIQKMLLNINTSVASGGKDLKTFARVAHMSATDFAAAWRADSMDTFVKFVKGIHSEGDKAFGTLKSLHFEDQRLIRTFISLAAAGDLLGKSTDYASDSFQKNTAFAREVGQRYSTLASHATVTWNNIKDLAIEIGNSLIPALKSLLDLLAPVIKDAADAAVSFGNLPSPIRNTALALTAMAIAVGPVLTAVGNLKVLYAALLMYGPKIAAAFGPVGVALAIVAAAVVTLAAVVKTASESLQRDMDKIVQESAKVGNAYEALRAKMRGEAIPAEGLQAMKDRMADLNTEIANLERSANTIKINISIGQGGEAAKAELAKIQTRIRQLTFEANKFRIAIQGAKVVPEFVGPPVPDDYNPNAGDDGDDLSKRAARFKANIEAMTKQANYMKALLASGLGFREAKIEADAFGDVMRADLDPMKGVGYELYRMSANARLAEASMERLIEKQKEHLDITLRSYDPLKKFLEERTKQIDTEALLNKNFMAAQANFRVLGSDMRREIDTAIAYKDAVLAGARGLRTFAVQQEITARLQPFAWMENLPRYAALFDMFKRKVTATVINLAELARFNEYATEMQQVVQQFYDGIENALEDSLARFLETGKFSFKELWKEFVSLGTKAIAQLVIKWAKAQFVMGAYGKSYNSDGSAMSTWAKFASHFGKGGYTTTGGTTVSYGTIAGVAGVAAIVAYGIWSQHNAHLKTFDRITGGAGLYGTGMIRGGGVGRQADAIGKGIAQILNGIQDATGQLFSMLPNTLARVRNDGKKIQVWINNQIIGTFKDIGEATLAAAKASFLGSNLATALDPIIKQAILNYQGKAEDFADYLKGVQETLDKARGISDFAIQIRNLDLEAARMADTLIQAGVSFRDATTMALASEVRSLLSMREQLTGEHDPKAELAAKKADAALWNAKFLLMKIQIQAERDTLAAQIKIFQAKMKLGITEVQFDHEIIRESIRQAQIEENFEMNYLRDRAYLTGQRIKIDQAGIDAMVAQLAALDAILAELNKVGLIDLSKIKLDGGSLGGHLKGLGKSMNELKGALQDLAKLQRDMLTGPNSPFTTAQQADIAGNELFGLLSKGKGIKADEVRRIIDLVPQYLDLLGQSIGTGGSGYFQQFSQIQEMIANLLTANGVTPLVDWQQQLQDMFGTSLFPGDTPTGSISSPYTVSSPVLEMHAQATADNTRGTIREVKVQGEATVHAIRALTTAINKLNAGGGSGGGVIQTNSIPGQPKVA